MSYYFAVSVLDGFTFVLTGIIFVATMPIEITVKVNYN